MDEGTVEREKFEANVVSLEVYVGLEQFTVDGSVKTKVECKLVAIQERLTVGLAKSLSSLASILEGEWQHKPQFLIRYSDATLFSFSSQISINAMLKVCSLPIATRLPIFATRYKCLRSHKDWLKSVFPFDIALLFTNRVLKRGRYSAGSISSLHVQ